MNAERIRLDDGDRTWNFDRSFLESNWTCIWNQGCVGIAAEPDSEAQLGCCSVGAEMLDEDEAMRIAALAATLDSTTAQFASEIAARGALRDAESDRASLATRVVDGACIFLNRPGFPGGEGCALHLAAVASGEPHIDWKPSICWQLPIKVERSEANGTEMLVRGWLRSDWGPEGESMAYCCTERDSAVANAFVGERPVIETLRSELEALLGSDLLDRLTAALDPPNA